MLINIAIEKTQPLTGTASCGEQRSVAFVGWMELLRAVADLVGGSGQPPDPSRSSDRDPRGPEATDPTLP